MKILIITVSDKGKKLKKTLTNLGLEDDIIVKRFKLKCNEYMGQSDGNACVKHSIWENTLTCIKYGLRFDNSVMVIQDDFVPNENILESIRNSKKLLASKEKVDMIFNSAAPNSSFITYNDQWAKATYCIGWQCVIFTNTFLDFVDKNRIQIEKEKQNQHNDVYFTKFFQSSIHAFIVFPSAGIQNNERMIRKYEYNIIYDMRYRCPYGDPITPLIILLVVIILIYVLCHR